MYKYTIIFWVFLVVFSLGCNNGKKHVSKNDEKKEALENKRPEVNIGGMGVKPIEGDPDDGGVARIGFYNVENLFDLTDEQNKKDDDFTPTGRNEWDKKKYERKINHLAKVIHYMGEPGIMGLCEVENSWVLKDLIEDEQFKNSDYGFVHQESPDLRGIDVALLYDKSEYNLLEQDFIRIDFPKKVVEDYTTRDVLYAVLQNSKKEKIHVFVNHWPSRRGGVEASEPKRTYVASQVKNKIDGIFRKNKKEHVVLIGDFNDEPFNKSVNEVLGAKPPVSDSRPGALYDLMYDLEKEGLGSYNYRGEWNMLDHVIVSGSLLDGKKTDVYNAKVFNRKWMLFYHEKSGQYRPNRTYSRGRYFGGYSDHLPVCVEIGRKK